MRPTEMITHSGRVVDLLRPTPADIDLGDIAYALANMCRFNGHCRPYYSVAEHSVRVFWCMTRDAGRLHADPNADRWAIMHDALEAYVGDMISPAKRALVDVPDPVGVSYDELCERWQGAIAERFDLTFPIPEEVRAADQLLLRTELPRLLPTNTRPVPTPLFFYGVGWTPHRAESNFREWADHVLSMTPVVKGGAV